MKYLRLWFVALVAVALLRDKPVIEEEWWYLDECSDLWMAAAPTPEPLYPAMPEPGEWINLNTLLGNK